MSTPAPQVLKPNLGEKSPFAEGPYKDTMGHGFKTPQALAGHIRQTGHMPIAVPMTTPGSAMQELLRQGATVEGLKQKFKYHPINFPVKIFKNSDGSITVSRPEEKDEELTERGQEYYLERLRKHISLMIEESLIKGQRAMDASSRDVLIASGEFSIEEAMNLSNTFLMWSGGGIGVSETRENYSEEDNDLLKFKDNYWNFFKETVSQMERVYRKYEHYKIPDIGSFKDIKKAVQPDGKIRLYRGITILREETKEDELDFIMKDGIENKMIINSADSWSANENTAYNFADPSNKDKSMFRGVVFEYDAEPEDVIMGWPFVGLPGEAEMVLDLKKSSFKVVHWEKREHGAVWHIRLEKNKNIQKALYSSKKDKVYWDLTGRNDYAIEKHRGLTPQTAIAMAKSYINGPYRIRITRTKRGYTLSLLPPEKMMISWLEKPIRGVKSAKGLTE